MINLRPLYWMRKAIAVHIVLFFTVFFTAQWGIGAWFPPGDPIFYENAAPRGSLARVIAIAAGVGACHLFARFFPIKPDYD